MKTINILSSLLLLSVTLFYSCNSDETITGHGTPSAKVVHGTVVNEAGYPVYPAFVSIDYGDPIAVNQDGSFNASAENLPYEIMAYRPGDSVFTFYVGLSSLKPVICLLKSYSYQPQNYHLATINLEYPRNPQSGLTYAKFISKEKAFSDQPSNIYDSSTTILVKWYGTSTQIAGKVIILRCLSEPNGVISTFTGFCAKDIVVTAGQTMSMRIEPDELKYDPPESEITVRIPEGFCFPELHTLIALDGYSRNCNIFFNEHLSPSPSATTVRVPGSLPLGYNIEARVSFETPPNQGMQISDLFISPGATVSAPDPPQFVLMYPSNDTAGLDSNTSFAHNGNRGVYVTHFLRTNSNVFSLNVVSSSNSVNMPVLSRYGLNVPSNTGFYWVVDNYDNYSSVDEFVTEKRFNNSPGNIFITSIRRFFFK